MSDKFKRITMDDRDIVRKYVERTNCQACDYSAANLVLWADVYDTKIYVEGDFMYIKFLMDDTDYFAFPMGDGDLKVAFAWMKSYCEETGMKFRMNIIEPHMYEQIEAAFPGQYDISYMRDYSDYVYNMEDLKNLSGKKFHGKKNHINKFLKTQDNWQYERITDENTAECIEMVKEWCIQNGCRKDEEKATELSIVINGLHYREELNLLGGLIRADGRVIAMTLGEKTSEDMFIVHFEKAFPDIDGAFPIINQQFVEHELGDIKYVNREEDLGIEGLRKAKESYHPAFMVQKGYLIEKTL